MTTRFLYPVLIVSLTSACLSPEILLAAKEKFERTKPHVNVGTIGYQGVSILVTNLRQNVNDATSCHFSGDLIATDNTPDRHAATSVLNKHIELPEGQSASIPISHPYVTLDAEGSRREISVEINPDDASDKHCQLATAVVGYDDADQATQYISRHRITKIDSLAWKQTPVNVEFLGYIGGNAKQAAKVILTSFGAPEQDAKQGPPCDYSGELLVQGVPILDADPNEMPERSYPVTFQGQDPVFVDVPFSVLGATDTTRADGRLTYAMRLKSIAHCSNWLDIGVQILDSQTGETRSNQMTRIPAHTPAWTDQSGHDPG